MGRRDELSKPRLDLARQRKIETNPKTQIVILSKARDLGASGRVSASGAARVLHLSLFERPALSVAEGWDSTVVAR